MGGDDYDGGHGCKELVFCKCNCGSGSGGVGVIEMEGRKLKKNTCRGCASVDGVY